MRTEKKQKQTQLGVWPAGETSDGFQKSVVFYSSNKLSTHFLLNRFYDYLQMAEPARALSVLTKLYFKYVTIPEAARPFNDTELDEFALIILMFADIAAKEGNYVSADRDQLLEELFRDGYYQWPVGRIDEE